MEKQNVGLTTNPIRRIRDRIINQKPLQKLTPQEWEDIQNRHTFAVKFLDEENPILSLLKNELNNAEEVVMENRLREVHEIHTITESFKKVFVTPKQIQDDELTGQIKFIRSFIREINAWIERYDEIKKMIDNGEIEVDENKE